MSSGRQGAGDRAPLFPQNRTAEQSPGDETGDAQGTYEADERG